MASDNLALARARIGCVLKERWHLEEVIGVGGMAAVYSAHHRNGARAAIKLLHGPLSEDAVVRERFLREAYLANSVDHVGVVRVLDDDADPKLGPFLVMELLDGESLLEILDRQGKVALPQALDIADQILDVLAIAHERGIVHRDLKPANLFVCKNGTVKVLDFGIARLLDDNAARLTRVGVPLGTPAYMAPEQARGLGRDVDGRADVYAVGATIFRTITGRHVHVGEGVAQIAMVAMQRAPLVSSVDASIPAAVCAVVDHALELELVDRYNSAREMQGDVKLVRAGKAPRVAPMRAIRRDSSRTNLPAVTPRKVGAKDARSEAVTLLADAAREKAHAIAKRPDAFSLQRPPPRPAPIRGAVKHAPAVPLPDDDDNLPTLAMDPDRARSALMGMGIDDTPPASSMSADDSAAVFARLPNVPVPVMPHAREVAMPRIEEATTDPGAGPLPFLDTAPHVIAGASPSSASGSGTRARVVPASSNAASSFAGVDGSGPRSVDAPSSTPMAPWSAPVTSSPALVDSTSARRGVPLWALVAAVMVALFFVAFSIALYFRR